MRRECLKFISLAWLVGLVLLYGCATTNLTTTWHDPAYSGSKRVQDVLIIAVTREETVRRIYEDRFAAELAKDNIRAVQSYTLKNSKLEPDRKAVEEAVREAGARSVLITRHISTDTRQHYRPPERISMYADPYYSRMNRYYPLAYREVHYTPGYNYSVTTVNLEANLYDAETEKLIWSAQSKSVDPQMTKKYIDGLVQTFAKDLKEKSLL
jgi:hypothetical protein